MSTHTASKRLEGYQAQIILDSVSPILGTRITTYEIQMPKVYVAEFNTHRSVPAVTRQIARNSASSRAIPVPTILERVKNDPVLPIDWRVAQSGMQQDIIMSDDDIAHFDKVWLEIRDLVVEKVEEMLSHNPRPDKQRVNRLLEPWMWTKIVATSTEWEPFFDLRDHPAAQPEFAYIAHLMHEAYKGSTPITREWHMPYVSRIDRSYALIDPLFEIDLTAILDKLPVEETNLGAWLLSKLLMSAARCGRVTYYKQGEIRTAQEDIERGLSFATNRHWSPLEHPCIATDKEEWYGPFYEWKSLRKYFPEENGRGRKR